MEQESEGKTKTLLNKEVKMSLLKEFRMVAG